MSLRLGLAAAVTVIVIAVGGALIVGGGPALPTPPPSPTAAASLTAAASPIAGASPAPGISAWMPYASEFYGFTFGYPEDWTLQAAATREWQAGDTMFDVDAWPYADTFASPDEASVGLLVWEMLAGEGADLDSVQGLKAWAETFCTEVDGSSCAEFTRLAVPMCLNAGGDSCRPALLVPTPREQYAFFMDWSSAMFTNSPDRVRVVVVAREDSFPAAARYGGSVELIRSILTTMDVWTPGQVPPAN